MSFFEELKRRNVFRVGIAYAVSAWVVLQVADLVLDNIEAPGWVMSVFMLVAALGFIIALIVAWAYEVTPEGIKRESEVQKDQSITHHTARRLDKITLAAVGILIVFLLLDRFMFESPSAPSQEPIVAPLAERPAETVSAPLTLEVEPRVNRKSIAVLPLANRSVNDEDAFFAEGIHDEILTRLSRIADLKVISRTSVMGYANTTKKMAEIGSELGVAHLLEGGVQRAGNRVRINVQLIEAQTDRHLWAEVYDRELTADNLFDIQSEITRSISDELQAVLTGDEREALDNKPTDNVEAYAYYLRAKALAAGYGRPDELIRESIRIYEAALELDPEFAAAWAALATDWTELHWSTTGIHGERDEAEVALAKARELAPDAAETLIAEGYLRYWGYLDYEPALTAFRSALEKKPGSVLALRGMAYTLRRMGRLDQSIATFRQAIELDPNDPGMPADLGYTLLHRGSMDEAEMMFRRAIAQDPDNLWNRWAFTGYFLMLNQPREALEMFGEIPERSSEGFLWGLHFAARILEDEEKMARVLDIWRSQELIEGTALIAEALWLKQQGQLGSVRDSLLEVEERMLEAAERSPDPDTSLSNLNIIYGLLGERQKLEANMERFERELKPDAMRIIEDFSRPYGWVLVGDTDKVLDYAEQAVEEFGIWQFSTYVQDPIFDPLRGQPRYKELALRYDRWLETVQ
ncbi:MAG: tetratricopeptide repeat protein [Xanthomonadales bacterium]|nr:tetratricopeptide repeat protein [Xanthomonadales bacterium]